MTTGTASHAEASQPAELLTARDLHHTGGDPAGGRRASHSADAVRGWLARELHDVVVQELTGIVVGLEALKRHAGDVDQERLTELQDAARTALTNLRLALYRLRREATVDRTFIAEVRRAGRCVEERQGINVTVQAMAWPNELSTVAAQHLLRIAQEALRNAATHSGARNVAVTLERRGAELRLSVTDDGRGMGHLGGPRTLGIRGMRERALLLGGVCHIDSTEEGTSVVARFPLEMLQ